MVWNPNIPTVTNRVQDDLNAIRANFQHLDRLAERVDELQTVSELAPVAGELQTVSALAPYVQAILDSRIVEQGENSNGKYIRWENGFQLCVSPDYEMTATTSNDVGTKYTPAASRVRWTFPAQFVEMGWVDGFCMSGDASPGFEVQGFATSISTSSASLGYWEFFTNTEDVPIRGIAIGWWK